jgi:hypothetical protein
MDTGPRDRWTLDGLDEVLVLAIDGQSPNIDRDSDATETAGRCRWSKRKRSVGYCFATSGSDSRRDG